MSTEAILDALAAKSGQVNGIKRAHGSGASDPDVAVLPDSLSDGPVAVVTYNGTDLRSQSEDLEHHFLIRVYVVDQGGGNAFKSLLPFVTRFLIALRTDKDLQGTCSFSYTEGIDPPIETEVGGRRFLVLPIRVAARDIDFSATITI